MTFGNRTPAIDTTLPPSPAYAPVHANPASLSGAMVGLRSAKRPNLSTGFSSFVGGIGGLGRKPDLAKRSLIGGA